jgi:hypothetical protein
LGLDWVENIGIFEFGYDLNVVTYKNSIRKIFA